MNPRLARLLMLLYPRSWRERYGAEFDFHDWSRVRDSEGLYEWRK
jgi:hypothetical protein